MKFSIHRQAFIKSLNDVQRAVASKTTIPILTGIKLVVTNDALILTGSDSELTIESTISTDEEESQLIIQKTGAVVLPSRFFGEIIKKLPSDTVTIEVNDHFQATISSGSASFTLNGIDVYEYPHLPEIDSDQVIVLPVPLLRQMIQQTIISASVEESRPILSGIHFVLKDNLLKAVATDSHRLSQRIIPLQIDALENSLEYEFTIPRKTLIELSRIIEGLETIELSIKENLALFQTEHLSFFSRLLDGRYPDVERLIVVENTTQLVIQANELLNAAERASLMSNANSSKVAKITLSSDSVRLTSQSPEIGTVEEELSYESTEGSPMEISFNPDYLKDALRTFGHSEIVITFNSVIRPFKLEPKDPLSSIDNSFVQLITPVRTFA
ncbi:DNA polymerase III subunit beta [Granulicatella seriolae]|uniref:Beta sliding clamp n=1 Tax=Granulicatella seriolae TaxID=2967226 RepID=A0ABT1WQW9_9LACT|nr:DNA polymerase III subunit beta [Granulicatella seriolae]